MNKYCTIFIENKLIIMILKESKLRSMIKDAIKRQLNEGYSSKSHQEEIVEIAKEMYNELFVNGKSFYQTEYTIPIDGKSYMAYVITGQFGKKENGYQNRNGITITVTKETTPNTIAKLLMHEFTHIFDIIRDKKRGVNYDDLYTEIKNSYGIPNSILNIIYHLWIPTEFNAFQTTYDFNDENFNAMFERFMGYIQEAYELPTTKSNYWADDYSAKWEGIRDIVKKHIPNRYQKCDVDTFKKYFVTHSMGLLKKLVKKWNGEQNANFV